MAAELQQIFMDVATLTVGELLPIHVQLGLAEVEEGDRTQMNIWMLITRHLISEEVQTSEDGGQGHLLWIQTYIQTLRPPPPPPQPPAEGVVVAPVAVAPVPGIPAAAAAATMNGGAAAMASPVVVKPDPDSLTGVVAGNAFGSSLRKALKKDFKIRGSIGMPGQKDKLTFSSLAYQINSGVKKSYTEEEICDEVIRVCDGASPLRPILEGKSNLSLENLRSILRSYFQEKDPTTLFNFLSNAVQKSTETAMDFVLRLWELRQKVLFVTNEMDSRVRYSEDLVQDQFVRALITGLRNDNIRNEIKPVIEGTMEIQELLEIMNRASSDETEREAKLKRNNQKINKVEVAEEYTGCDGNYCLLKDSPKEEKKENQIVAELKKMNAKLNQVTAQNTEMQNEMANLKEQYEQLDKTKVAADDEKKSPPKIIRIRFGCKNCKKDGLRNCHHCFGCGSEDHVKADCPGK